MKFGSLFLAVCLRSQEIDIYRATRGTPGTMPSRLDLAIILHRQPLGIIIGLIRIHMNRIICFRTLERTRTALSMKMMSRGVQLQQIQLRVVFDQGHPMNTTARQGILVLHTFIVFLSRMRTGKLVIILQQDLLATLQSAGDEVLHRLHIDTTISGTTIPSLEPRSHDTCPALPDHLNVNHLLRYLD